MDGNLLDTDALYSRVGDAFIDQSSVLKEIFDLEIFKHEVYMNSIDDEDLRGRIEAYIADLNVLKDDISLGPLVQPQ